jgi:hypothetical protein
MHNVEKKGERQQPDDEISGSAEFSGVQKEGLLLRDKLTFLNLQLFYF